jgi:hypothetical protein
MADKMIHIIGGGTFSHVRNHLALAAPAFGSTAKQLYSILDSVAVNYDYRVQLHLTKMAGGEYNPLTGAPLVTNDDVSALLDKLIADKTTRVIILNAALCDFDGSIDDVASGKYEERLKTSRGEKMMRLTPADKLIGKVRKVRKDIFLVAFKTTTNATADEQYLAGLDLLKRNSANLVVANDTVTRHNMVIAPEETRYHETNSRAGVLMGLADMTIARMNNIFTRSTVVGTEEEETVPWDSPLIPENLREVVNYCIKEGAYKPFNGSTAGHFAVRLGPNEILTSKRKRNFNDLDKIGLVRVEYDGLDKVIAHGAKPSASAGSRNESSLPMNIRTSTASFTSIARSGHWGMRTASMAYRLLHNGRTNAGRISAEPIPRVTSRR